MQNYMHSLIVPELLPLKYHCLQFKNLHVISSRYLMKSRPTRDALEGVAGKFAKELCKLFACTLKKSRAIVC